MARNLQTLNSKELSWLINNYDITYDNDLICVKTYNNRITKHKVDEKFVLSTKIKKLTFSTDSIKFWIRYFYGQYTLMEVQNIFNFLKITYQNINKVVVKRQLRKQRMILKLN